MAAYEVTLFPLWNKFGSQKFSLSDRGFHCKSLLYRYSISSFRPEDKCFVTFPSDPISVPGVVTIADSDPVQIRFGRERIFYAYPEGQEDQGTLYCTLKLHVSIVYNPCTCAHTFVLNMRTTWKHFIFVWVLFLLWMLCSLNDFKIIRNTSISDFLSYYNVYWLSIMYIIIEWLDI